MRKNLIPLLVIALVVAVLSTVVFYGLVADRLEPAKSASASTGPAASAMLVAARNVDRGKLLESADVRVSELSCPPGQKCVAQVGEALGRATLDPLVEGQTLAESALSRPAGISSPSSVIPVGMRAVTMHAADSIGVVQMVRAGDRVDIQVISARDPVNPNTLEIRAVLRSVEVLNIGPPETGSPLSGRPVVTVLLSPADADRVSLADTVGRLRIVLRNRQDADPSAGPSATAKPMAVAAPGLSSAPAPVAKANPAALSRDIYFDVQWISPKRSDALDILSGHFSPNGDALQVRPVIGNKSWATLEGEGRLAVIAKSQVLTRDLGEVSLQREGQPGLRILLSPRVRGDGQLSLRIEPSVNTPSSAKEPGGPTTERRIRSELSLAPGQSFLVTGLEAADGVFALITPRVVVRAQE